MGKKKEKKVPADDPEMLGVLSKWVTLDGMINPGVWSSGSINPPPYTPGNISVSGKVTPLATGETRSTLRLELPDGRTVDMEDFNHCYTLTIEAGTYSTIRSVVLRPTTEQVEALLDALDPGRSARSLSDLHDEARRIVSEELGADDGEYRREQGGVHGPIVRG